MTRYLPVCAHTTTCFARLDGNRRLTKCVACGAEFLFIAPDEAAVKARRLPKANPPLAERTLRRHRQHDREQRLRIERARERMFTPA